MDSLTRHNDKPSIEPGPAPSHEAGEQDKVAKEDNNRLRRSKQLPVGIPMEAAASHLLTAGVGWLALKFWRMFKRQQREVQVASGEPTQPLHARYSVTCLHAWCVDGDAGRQYHLMPPLLEHRATEVSSGAATRKRIQGRDVGRDACERCSKKGTSRIHRSYPFSWSSCGSLL